MNDTMTIHIPDERHYKAAFSSTVFVRQRRGVIGARGDDRLDLLHRLSTNATRDLAVGEETTTILTSDKGRIVELLRVVAFSDHLLLVLSGEEAGRVREWLDKYTIMDDFRTEDLSASYEVIALFGDHARGLLVRTFDLEPPNAGGYATFAVAGADTGDGADEVSEANNTETANHLGVVLRETRISGAGSFLLVVPRTGIAGVLERLNEQGAEEIDEATWEVLRIEAGIPSTGSELGEGYNPLESGLVQYISFTKGCYIGQEVIARLDTYDKVQRHLVGLRIEAIEGAEEDGHALLISAEGNLEVRDPADGRKIGTVTSLAESPALHATIGLAYLRTAEAVPGLAVNVVSVDGETVLDLGRAVVMKLPFDR